MGVPLSGLICLSLSPYGFTPTTTPTTQRLSVDLFSLGYRKKIYWTSVPVYVQCTMYNSWLLDGISVETLVLKRIHRDYSRSNIVTNF